MIVCAAKNGICLLEFSDRKILENKLQSIVKLSDTPKSREKTIDIQPLNFNIAFVFKLTEKYGNTC